MRETIGQRMSKFLDEHFAGRTFELEYFKQTLRQLEDRPERVLNLFGPSGIGKTYLVNRYAQLAGELGAITAKVDAREALGIPERLCDSILHAFGARTNEESEAVPVSHASVQPRFMTCVNAINEQAGQCKVVLILDGYEEIGSLDYWVRERLLPGLSTNVLIVIAGRYPLAGPWSSSPAWKKLIVHLRLSELSYEETSVFLQEWGIADDRLIDELWLRTLGHPLSLSLLMPGTGQAAHSVDFRSWEPPDEVVRRWLGEAPDERLRQLLYAGSIPRSFHQELLSEIMEQEVSVADFERLIGLSFVIRHGRGWQLTEIVWETLRRSFKARMPETFAQYVSRAVKHYERIVAEGVRIGKDRRWEIAQLMRFSSSPLLRAHLRHSRESAHYLVPVDASNRHEAEDYIRLRLVEAKPLTIRCSDPDTDALFRFDMTAEESLIRLKEMPIAELLDSGTDSLQMLRSGDGGTVGLFAIVPILEKTLPFLRSAPLSRTYFQSMDESFFGKLPEEGEKPAGWFVYGIDVSDPEDEELRSEIVHALFERILDGGLVLQSPPPLDYYRHACEGLGFERVECGHHTVYGERHPASTYAVDTRNQSLGNYLRKMIPELERGKGSLVSAEKKATADLVGESRALKELTPREREVAEQLAIGLSNAEIAATLFMSEAAVKKHINAMLSKFGFKNRTQLARIVIEGGRPSASELNK